MLGTIIDQRDLAIASVTFHLGAMMMGAHNTDMATLENWNGGIRTSGEISGKGTFKKAATCVRRR